MLPVNCRINATALFRLRSSVSDSRNRETVISFSLDSQAWRLGKVAVAVIDAVLEQVSGQGTDGRLDGRSSLFRPISPALPSPPRATHPTRLARALAALTLCPLPSPPLHAEGGSAFGGTRHGDRSRCEIGKGSRSIGGATPLSRRSVGGRLPARRDGKANEAFPVDPRHACGYPGSNPRRAPASATKNLTIARCEDQGARAEGHSGQQPSNDRRRIAALSLANPVGDPRKPVFGFFVPNIEKSKRA